MKEQIINELEKVQVALNNISVSGRQNLSNLLGAQVMLEQIAEQLKEIDINVAKPAK